MPDSGPLSESGLLRLLDHEGNLTEVTEQTAELSQIASALTPADLRQMYADMFLVRSFDREATSLQRQGELGLWVQCLGQEGAQIGSAHALSAQDFVFPSYREHGVLQVRGIPQLDLMKQFRGVDHGGWNPADYNTHLYTLVIGSHTLHATGYAMGMQRNGTVGTGDPATDSAVVAYFGDGATAQGDVNEALVFAAVNNAPIVFFCQNNQWAISESTLHQARVPLAQRGDGFGVPNLRIDGNDVLVSYAAAKLALDQARAGQGPYFIEALTYRMGAHTTSDDPTRYRSREQEQYWAQRDPLARLETYLKSLDELPQDFVDGLNDRAAAEAEALRDGVRNMGRPSSFAMFEHVYATEHALVNSEREWFGAYVDSFGGAK